MSDAAVPSWTIAAEPVDAPVARALFRAYYTEVADRYYTLHEGRRATPEEIGRGVAEYTGEGLRPPRGVLLVARHGGEPAGCAGARLLDARTAELKQVFVRPGKRGLGIASGLLRAAEAAAVRLGAERIRLDTRLDLTEAIALYRRRGYVEIAPYHFGDPYAEIFFEKRLAPPQRELPAPQQELTTPQQRLTPPQQGAGAGGDGAEAAVTW
ncbi:GNAT family N-acetyltransferase [Streptomyces sp. MspMP-M5]|uniref:GNAT family N-acetyltransferase n=1 Tax=unclassified Streptomyces TaxID=2593676 RepID=UPI00035C7C37|nr:GNAT family N-acetyltransferase [Streptomyces sp. MspMP-M5]MYT28402.1 GNAT family N-acetyltransferase [Streptomyces sp. SID8354]